MLLCMDNLRKYLQRALVAVGRSSISASYLSTPMMGMIANAESHAGATESVYTPQLWSEAIAATPKNCQWTQLYVCMMLEPDWTCCSSLECNALQFERESST